MSAEIINLRAARKAKAKAAAQAHADLDVDVWCERLDTLAARVAQPTFEALRAMLFEDEGFTGNRTDYADPENSFLDAVITRRVGIPITLSVLTMEVGRRLGLDIRGVGMPGHFLVQEAAQKDTWCDPFHDGRCYSLDECRSLFARLHGPASKFHLEYLAPSSPHDIIARILTNLEHGRLASDPLQLAWMCDLHLALPTLNDADRTRMQRAARSVRARWN